MKICITGANGMLGEKCATMLSERYSVCASDIGDSLLYPIAIPYLQLDISDYNAMKRLIKKVNPDVIINCAAYTDVDGAEEHRESAWKVNVEGIENIVKAAEPLKSHIIHISTDYVFDGVNGPYSEEDEPKPINYYGETKLASEKVLEEYPFNWTIIRTNIIYGNSYNQKASFVNWVINKLQNNDKINIVNDQFGNPTWADGLAMAINKIIEKQASGIYHYGGADYLNRFEFTLKITDAYNLNNKNISKITTRSLGQLAKRPYKAVLISEKIANELGAKLFTIQEALNAIKLKEES